MLFSYVCLLYIHIKYISNFTGTDVILTPSVLIPVFLNFICVYILYTHMCLCAEGRRGHEGSSSFVLYLILLRQNISLTLEFEFPARLTASRS